MTRRAKERRLERVQEKQRASEERAARDHVLNSRPAWRKLLAAIDGPHSAVQLSGEQEQQQQQQPSPSKHTAHNQIVNELQWKSTHVPIAAASVFQLPIKLDAPKGVLHYEFSTRDYDVNFSVQMICADGSTLELLEPQRYESQKHAVKAQLELAGPGLVLLIWDNSFSWLNTKQLAYSIELTQETPEAAETRKTALAQRERLARVRALAAKDAEVDRLQTAIATHEQSIEFITHQLEALERERRSAEARKAASLVERERANEQIDTLAWEIQALNWRALDTAVLHAMFACLSPRDLAAWSLASSFWARKVQDFRAADTSDVPDLPSHETLNRTAS